MTLCLRLARAVVPSSSNLIACRFRQFSIQAENDATKHQDDNGGHCHRTETGSVSQCPEAGRSMATKGYAETSCFKFVGLVSEATALQDLRKRFISRWQRRGWCSKGDLGRMVWKWELMRWASGTTVPSPRVYGDWAHKGRVTDFWREARLLSPVGLVSATTADREMAERLRQKKHVLLALAERWKLSRAKKLQVLLKQGSIRRIQQLIKESHEKNQSWQDKAGFMLLWAQCPKRLAKLSNRNHTGWLKYRLEHPPVVGNICIESIWIYI